MLISSTPTQCLARESRKASSPSAIKLISPVDPNIRYNGRWNFDDPSVPWVLWQGSSILVKFEGTGLSMDIGLSNAEQYRVIIDGVPETSRRKISAGRDTYVLAENLQEGIHTIEFFKETFYGKSHFHGLEDTSVLPENAVQLASWSKGNLNMMKETNHVFGSRHPWLESKMPDSLEELCFYTHQFISEIKT